MSEIKSIGVTESEVERTLLQKDDLLFVEGNGSKEQIGRVAIWDGSVENCLHQNHLIFWVKDKSLADLDSLPDPDVLAADIIDNLQSAMDSFNELMATLKKEK